MKQIIIDHLIKIVFQEYNLKLEEIQLSTPPKKDM
jgi:hypothetical protein